MPMLLYDGMKGYAPTNRVLATLFEKEVTDFKVVKVDLATGAQKTPEHLALQPFGMIPVLVDGSITVYESRAIARYIARKYEGQGTPLYGSTLADNALVEQWLEVESQNFNPVIHIVVFEIYIKPFYGGKTDEALVAANIVKLEKILDIYDAHLAKSKYLAGDFFSLADVSHIPYTHNLIARSKLGHLIDSRPHVKVWWDDISSRPAWKKVKDVMAVQFGNLKLTDVQQKFLSSISIETD